jgi:ABC-type uncharacterized transport system ATPase subunit
MYLHWWSPTTGISQIWLKVREESRKFKKPAIFRRLAWNYYLNVAMSKKKNLKSSESGDTYKVFKNKGPNSSDF